MVMRCVWVMDDVCGDEVWVMFVTGSIPSVVESPTTPRSP